MPTKKSLIPKYSSQSDQTPLQNLPRQIDLKSEQKKGIYVNNMEKDIGPEKRVGHGTKSNGKVVIVAKTQNPTETDTADDAKKQEGERQTQNSDTPKTLESLEPKLERQETPDKDEATEPKKESVLGSPNTRHDAEKSKQEESPNALQETPPPLPPMADISLSLEQTTTLEDPGISQPMDVVILSKEETQKSEKSNDKELEPEKKSKKTLNTEEHNKEKEEPSQIKEMDLSLPSKESLESDNPAEQWTKHWDEGSGFYYFMNSETGESQWEPPGTDEWFEALDTESGFAYLMNPRTGESMWKEDKDPSYPDSVSIEGYTTDEASIGDPLTIWEELKDPLTGQHYYYSNVSQSSQWVAPLWMDYICSETGALYYFNTKTQESIWDRPKGFIEEAQDEDDPVDPAMEIEELAATDVISTMMLETPRMDQEGVAVPTPRLVPAPNSDNSKHGTENSMAVGYSFSKRPKLQQT